MTGRNGVDGQNRDPLTGPHDGNAHLRRQFLAMERPAEVDRNITFQHGALNGHRLAGSLRSFAEGERHDVRRN